MSDYFDPQNEELLQDFFTEAGLQVEALESNILVLENDIGNQDAVDEIFRAAHTLKGAAGTVQMTELSDFTHLVEDLLDRIRDGEVTVTADLTDSLLQAIDVIKAMIDARSQGDVYDGDVSRLAAALKQATAGGKRGSAEAAGAAPRAGQAAPAAAAGPREAPGGAGESSDGASSDTGRSGSSASPDASGAKQVSEYELLELREAAGDDRRLVCMRVEFNEDNPMNTVGGIQVYSSLRNKAEVLKTEPEFDALYEDEFHPVVEYYVATDQDPERIASSIAISDVTTAITPLRLETAGAEQPAASAAGGERAAGGGHAAEAERKPTPAGAAPDEDDLSLEELEAADDTAEQSGAVTGAAPAETQPEAASAGAEKAGGKAEAEARKKVSGSVLRVDSKRIDDLLNLVSETVINKASFNQLSNTFNELLSQVQEHQEQHRGVLQELFEALPSYLERAQRGESPKDLRREFVGNFERVGGIFDPFQAGLKNTVSKYRNTAQNLGRITGELQEGVMRIRMVPIAQIFSRFPRLVRDLSRSLNKGMRLKIEGEDTELDKSVIEDLLDPLIHCVRNALDHGIESAEERRKSGKAEEATVTLSASNEGNMILIEVSDDGRGIDVESVRAKAVERGVVHPSKTLTDLEAFNLIFEPGFSTAKEITNVSGRGVGLDVVKRQIEKLNGEVSVWSVKGSGTKFTIKIPLTLAIIQGLLVRVGKEMYVIPITSVIESHRIKPSDIKMLDNYEVFNVREDVVSLLRLNRLFKVSTDEEKDHVFVVIVGSGDKKMGLIVDSLIGEEDVVIKPLRDHYTNAPGIAGANITGDGTVSLIIDVPQLLELGLRQEIEHRRKLEGRIA